MGQIVIIHLSLSAFDFSLFVNVPRISYACCREHTDRPGVCANTQTRAPVQPQILLAVQRKRDGSLEEGQVSTDGALSVSVSLPLFPCHRWTQSHLFLSHMP